MDPKVVQTVMEMLYDRKYTVLNTNDNETIHAIHNVTKKKMKVFFMLNDKVGIKHINEIVDRLQDENCIIVFKHNITYFAKQALEEHKNIEFFDSDSLKFNITHHYLVPKHEIVSKEVKLELLKKYKIHEKNLPLILKSDPISKYYGAKAGDLFEITRTNENGFGYSLTYRMVN